MTLQGRGSKSSTQRKRIVIPFRAVFKWLVRLRRSPRAVAGGFALGVFLAFTPTIGFQLVLAVFLATVLNLNRPAAMLTVWITNVATMAPIYTFNYWVGSLFLSGPPVSEVYQTFGAIGTQLVKMEFWKLGDQFETMLGLSSAMAVPLVIGSVLVGLIAAALTYLVSFALISMLLTRRQKRAAMKKKSGR